MNTATKFLLILIIACAASVAITVTATSRASGPPDVADAPYKLFTDTGSWYLVEYQIDENGILIASIYKEKVEGNILRIVDGGYEIEWRAPMRVTSPGTPSS